MRTGLTIASHTGTSTGAFEQLEVLEEEGVSLEAFVWVHAQAEKDLSRRVEAANRGAWVSLDNVNRNQIGSYVEMLLHMKNRGVLHKTLLSHDAGWYSPGEEKGGSFRGYEEIFTDLLPALRRQSFTERETRQLLIENPAQAFSIQIRAA
jgi:phosphotriesterase-related protein